MSVAASVLEEVRDQVPDRRHLHRSPRLLLLQRRNDLRISDGLWGSRHQEPSHLLFLMILYLTVLRMV